MGPRSTGTSAPPTPRKPSAPASATAARLGRVAPRPGAPGDATSAVLSEATARKETGDRDMRRKRPPALSFLLRMSTGAPSRARRLAARARLRRRRAGDLHRADPQGASCATTCSCTPALHETERILPFAYLLTALLFARSGLYADARAAPGPLADRRLAVPGRRSSRCCSRSSAANTSPATTSSTARSPSRCSTSPRCAPPTSG